MAGYTWWQVADLIRRQQTIIYKMNPGLQFAANDIQHISFTDSAVCVELNLPSLLGCASVLPRYINHGGQCADDMNELAQPFFSAWLTWFFTLDVNALPDLSCQSTTSSIEMVWQSVQATRLNQASYLNQSTVLGQQVYCPRPHKTTSLSSCQAYGRIGELCLGF